MGIGEIEKVINNVWEGKWFVRHFSLLSWFYGEYYVPEMQQQVGSKLELRSFSNNQYYGAFQVKPH